METESSTAQTWHRRQYNLFPEKDRGSTYERRKNMKLNIKKFMMTEPAHLINGKNSSEDRSRNGVQAPSGHDGNVIADDGKLIAVR